MNIINLYLLFIWQIIFLLTLTSASIDSNNLLNDDSLNLKLSNKLNNDHFDHNLPENVVKMLHYFDSNEFKSKFNNKLVKRSTDNFTNCQDKIDTYKVS